MKARLIAVLLGLACVPRAALAADAATAAANAECAQILADTATDCDQLKTAMDAKTAAVAAGQDVSALETQIQTLASKPLSPLFVEKKKDGQIHALHCPAVKRVKACVGLASLLKQSLIDKPTPEVKQELDKEVALQQQPDRQTSNNKSGSAAQADPVESIQPIALAGGAVSLSGTRAGTKGVGTITVNPFAVASPGDVTASRFLDLSVSAPFDLDGGTSQNRYVSARLRANFTAPISTADLKTALKAYFAAEGKQVVLLENVLEQATDRRGCAESVLTTTKVTVEACGQTLDDAFERSLRADAYKKIEAARRAADAYYFGLDARLDTGDPTGTIVVGDKGTHLLGGLAAGRRFEVGGLWDWELRGRAAFDYFKSRDAVAGPDPKPISSFDWGCAMILSGRLTEQAKQRMAFGVGIEGRHAGSKVDAKAELAPTNYANLNLLTIVPAADGSDLGLAISIPLADGAVPRGTIISLSTDLGLLDHSTSK